MSNQKPALCTVQQVANFFLDKGREENVPITQIKLIKIVYFAYGWMLAIKGKHLFPDRIEAWKHGPVIPALYHEFKWYGSYPINQSSREYDCETDKLFVRKIILNADSEYIINILSDVWEKYKNFPAGRLIDETHKKNSPWHDIYEKNGGNIPHNTQIEDTPIKIYFLKELGLENI
ncbi:Panacea domain-containing protein [Bartonella sp. cb54]|uniref:Panacea domain-containing protein n=1 Tax=Bartonella sp. cb54 TaxID=3385560 RepID=UPI0039A5D750